MSNLTHEQIVEIFRQSRERKQKERQKEQEMKSQIKAIEAKKYQKAYREKVKREKEAQRAKEQAEWERARCIPMDDWILKDSGDLYTEYELRNIETLYPREKGRLNFKWFDNFIKQARENERNEERD